MEKNYFLSLSLFKILLACHLYALSPGQQAPTDTLAARVDSLISAQIKPGGPGCAVAVIRDGKLIFKRGYGLANLDWEIPNTPATVFNLASISKQFTAACVVLLSEDGKLSLDDDIRSWLPEIRDYGHKITIRHLINHTSGIRDYESLMIPAGMRYDIAYEPKEIFDLIVRQQALDFVPGEKHSYSNSGYILLAEIVRRTSGLTLGRFAEERIFKPLGMKNTFYYDNLHRVVKNRATGYNLDLAEEKYISGHHDTYTVGPGGVCSTVEDLALWDRNFYENRIGGPHFIETLLERAVLNSGDTVKYACGLEHGSYHGLPNVSHTGWWAGFLCHMVRFPEQKLTIIILANSTIDIPPVENYRKIADLCLYDQFPPEKRPKPEQKAEKKTKPTEVTVDPAVFNRYTGRYEVGDRDAVLIVTRDGGRLMGQLQGEMAFRMYPESDSVFFVKVDEVQVKFPSDETGKVNHMLWCKRGRENVFKRFEPGTTEEELRQYSGEYYSEDLQTTWRMAPKGNWLEFKSSPGTIDPSGSNLLSKDPTGENLLIQKKDDLFNFWYMELWFGRDDKGRVTGFELSSRGAAWKVNFARK